MSTLTPGDAEDFRRHLLADGLSLATVGKRIKNAKQFFTDAFKRRLIPANPFEDVKGNASTNRARLVFVDRPTIAKVIAACPDAEWRLLLALSKYAGLRCPSEHLALTWADINWADGRMRVTSSKTKNIGKGSRIVPIFPELRPYLQDVFDRAEPGAVHVITRYRQTNVNLRTQLERIIVKAGVVQWPGLFHNLRASCQTELANHFPAHVASEWIGNSEAVARAHYLQVTDDHFAAAIGGQNRA